MSKEIESWPDWPANGLESVGSCPVCNSKQRNMLYKNLKDRLFGAPGLWSMYLCSDCKSGFLDPRPNPDTVGLAYSHYATHNSRKEQNTDNLFVRIKLAVRNGYLNKRYGYSLSGAADWGYWVMLILPSPIRWEWDHYARNLRKPVHENMKVLDIGCGNGEFLKNAMDAGWKVEGIEPDPKAALIASSRNIKISNTMFELAEYPSSHFDVICLNQVIEHVHNPRALIENIFKWLKPGGVVWIGTPNLDSSIHHRFAENYGNLHPPQHLTIFNRKSLQNLVKSAGFSDISFIKRGFHDYSQCLGSSALKRGLTNESVYMGVRNAPVKDRILGLFYELSAWLSIDSCSDLILTARKPK